MTFPARHLAVTIARPADETYRFARDPEHLGDWAAGLAEGSITVDGDRLVVDSPMGRVVVEFAADNTFGVLDHVVTLPDGAAVLNPLRVAPNGDGCDVVFTVHRRPDVSDDAFDADCAAVQRDLETLRELLER